MEKKIKHGYIINNAADDDGQDEEVFSENGDGSESEDGGSTRGVVIA